MDKLIVLKKEQLGNSAILEYSNCVFSNIICLGLGPLNKSVAQWQLSWLLHMNSKKITVYDPIFEKEDLDILKKFGLEVLEEYVGNGNNSLFYMPHCEYQLMERIVQQNLFQLDKITIIGTSYSAIRDKRFYSDLKSFAKLWTQFRNTIEDDRAPLNYNLVEIPIRTESWIDPHAFNDMSVIKFEKTA
eukprot:NODE_126_length_18761_cov_0.476262.p7 type:complete len:188 gc:universal NODE_126_length_18761_cov_0.476262:8505-7942(-)